jgi:hypothetical protein
MHKLEIYIYTFRTTAVAEFPITLVHPISMDPPPGNYAASKSINSPSHLFMQETLQKNQIEEKNEELGSPIVSFLPLNMETSSIVKNTYDLNSNSCRNSYFADTEASRKSSFVSTNMFEERSIYSLDTVASKCSGRNNSNGNLLNKMHKRLSDWKDQASSSTLSKQAYVSPGLSDRLESSRSSLLSIEPSSISSSFTDDRSSEKLLLRCSNRVMRFGHIKGGPKQFGHHPNCLGDASLDIRKHFNEHLQEGISAMTDPLFTFDNLDEHEDYDHYGDDEDTDIDSIQFTTSSTPGRTKKIYKNSVVSLDTLDSRNQGNLAYFTFLFHIH